MFDVPSHLGNSNHSNDDHPEPSAIADSRTAIFKPLDSINYHTDLIPVYTCIHAGLIVVLGLKQLKFKDFPSHFEATSDFPYPKSGL